MDVSIFICTRNRAGSLRDTLSSLRRAHVPDGVRMELVVVDNGSTDGTREVVESMHFGWGAPRHEVEPEPGVSHARNRAIRVGRGDVLLWTDDDVRVPVDWIPRMIDPINRGDCDAVAGGVRLAAGRARHWMGTCTRAWFASSETLDPQRPGRLIGANMAFHRRVLDAARGFDTVLGPGGLGMGEETLFSYQIERAGYRIASAFDVVVDHVFDPGRLCPAGLASIACSMGRSEAYIAHHWHGAGARHCDSMIFDARLRLLYWKARSRLQSAVPPGLMERRLQALARVHYWQFLKLIRSTPRKYHTPTQAAGRPCVQHPADAASSAMQANRRSVS